MNTKTARITSATTLLTALAALALTGERASAQAVYDRSLRPQDVSITAAPVPGQWIVSVDARFSNNTQQTLDLGCVLTATINGLPVGGGSGGGGGGPFYRPVIMYGNLGYPCGLGGAGSCGGICNIGSSCQPAGAGECGCFLPMERVIFGPFVLSAGDVIQVNADAMAGSMPEIDNSNDSVHLVFGGTPCPVDINGDGRVDVRDYLAFLQLYAAAAPHADINGDGHVNVADYLAFLQLYSAGCR